MVSIKLAVSIKKWGDGINARTSARWAKAKVMLHELQALIKETDSTL